MFRKLLVPLDGSSNADRAAQAAAELVKDHKSSVVLLHAIRDLSLPKEIQEMISTGEVTASRMQILQDSANIVLTNAKKRFEEAGFANVETVCLLGAPESVIADYAEKNGVDLVVLGHRGLGRHRGRLGGVARKLVGKSEFSCLVVS
jgi:nucleotide-binding universal stress UspA family protein